jgi:hypothetical protein
MFSRLQTIGKFAWPCCQQRTALLRRRRWRTDALVPAARAVGDFTTDSITGTSISTPTTVASAVPEPKPNRLMAVATASSKKFLAPISPDLWR